LPGERYSLEGLREHTHGWLSLIGWRQMAHLLNVVDQWCTIYRHQEYRGMAIL